MAEQLTDIQQEIAASPSPARTFANLPQTRKRDVFFRLSERVRKSLIANMSRNQLQAFVHRLDPDEATDVLGMADEQTQEAVLEELNETRREKLSFLLGFDPETAAGVMDLNYITVSSTATFPIVAEQVRRFEDRTGRFPTVFVTDGVEFLGELPGPTLAMSDRGDETITEYIQEVPYVHYDWPEEEVIAVFQENREQTVAVVDEEDAIVGVIRADDMLSLIEEEAGETLYEFTGVAEEESVLDGPIRKIQSRYKWLIINLGTAFMAAAVVGLFEATIAALAVLAAYMPVVAGMGGNAGTQTMAVTVRGISLEQVSLTTGARVIVNEVIAGAANGIITGTLVAVIASVFNQSPLLGLVIGVSMVLNLVIAGFFGALIPLILDRLGQDPATSATIFITTATDVLGFFAFLGLAQAVLL
ncbi:magnesium transporter [Halococcus salsus]|uniref:magnesium transporter n=1 Tax=Halococcus salsus TaxID=2162894 RepID=UPI001357277C|nr:magnesium transporter [Halococcus salsus]